MDNVEVVAKIWGEEQVLINLEGLYCSKYLFVQPGFICSEHMHPVKHETFLCLGGSGFIRVNGELRPFTEGCKQIIPPGTWHMFGSVEGMTLLEVSTPHRDEDVQRRSESRAISPADKELWGLYHG